MEISDSNAWTGSNIFAHLNDFEPSIAERVLKNKSVPILIDTTFNDDRDNSSNGEDKENHNTSGIKISQIDETTNKSYVLQCQEDMTQDFIDYLKKMSSSYSVSSDAGELN